MKNTINKLFPFFLLLTSFGFAQVDSHEAIQNASPAMRSIAVAHRLQLVTSSVSGPQVNQGRPTLDVRDFHGVSVGAQIQAAHDSSSCPAAGCVIDVRGVGATGTIAGLSIRKPIRLLFGATAFTVTSTITFTNVIGCLIQGAGGPASISPTIFSWQGNKSTPMFRLVSVAGCTFRDFTLNANSSFPLTAFFTSERGSTGNPTNNAFYDIDGNGTNGGVIDGFRWLIGPGGDNGNDQFLFERVSFENYTNSGWNTTGSTQSQFHTFVRCEANGNGFGRYGYMGIGSVGMFNTSFGANTVADINVNQISNGVLLSGGGSIGSNRLYIDATPTSNSFAVTIVNFNFANNRLNPDGKVAIFSQRGPYLLLNDIVSGSQSKPSQFTLSPSGAQGLTATAIGNTIFTNLSSPFTVDTINGGYDWTLIGNTINTGSPVIIRDQSPHGTTTPVSINCTNITPVTVRANLTTDQNLMGCALPAGALNFPGKTLRIWAAGVYTTTVANTSTITIKAKLCTINGCGSGTVITPVSLTSAPNAGGQTNSRWTLQVMNTTQTTGSSSFYEAHGNMSLNLTGAAESVYTDSNTAAVGTIDATRGLFLQITGAFSVASGSNSFSQRQLVIDLVN